MTVRQTLFSLRHLFWIVSILRKNVVLPGKKRRIIYCFTKVASGAGTTGSEIAARPPHRPPLASGAGGSDLLPASDAPIPSLPAAHAGPGQPEGPARRRNAGR